MIVAGSKRGVSEYGVVIWEGPYSWYVINFLIIEIVITPQSSQEIKDLRNTLVSSRLEARLKWQITQEKLREKTGLD